MAPKPSHDILIHCDACGEDYSSTYRRCPFCGGRNDVRRAPSREPDPPDEELDDGYVFDGQDAFDDEPEEDYYPALPKGGKRLAPRQGGGMDLPPVNWPRLITFLCSLIIIVAALVIVFTVIYPQLHSNPNADPSQEVSAEPSPTPVPPSAEPSQEPTPPSADVTPSDEPSAPVTTPPPTGGQRASVVGAEGGLRVRSGPGTSYDIVASLYNGNSINVLEPSDNGWYRISFAGSGGQVLTGYIMGDYISTISGSGTTATPPPAPSGGNPTTGRTGTIVGADGGLRVRSGPGTSYDIVASLQNGNTITVVAQAENGWYQINFAGSGGQTMSGYIMGEYISTN